MCKVANFLGICCEIDKDRPLFFFNVLACVGILTLPASKETTYGEMNGFSPCITSTKHRTNSLVSYNVVISWSFVTNCSYESLC